MNRNHGRAFVVIVALLALGTLGVWLLWPRDDTPQRADGAGDDRTSDNRGPDGGGDDGGTNVARGGGDNGGDENIDSTNDDGTGGGETHHNPRTEVSAAEAGRAYRRGLELLNAGDLLAARSELSKAILSGGLSGRDERDAIDKAVSLAERTLLSREVFPDDPYVSYYTVQSGETLADQRTRKGIVNKLDLRVPSEAVLRVNRMRDARELRAGQDLKVVKGPFHAIVTKSRFACDVYLHREGLEPAFVKRLRVGLGQNGSTPAGLWQVSSKLPYATWYPPPNAPHSGPIRPGEPDYPLGDKGFWIGIEGLEENTQGRFGYGIHGTDDPSSIGREESLGCIRLADEDIALLFSLLREGHSTVEVRP